MATPENLLAKSRRDPKHLHGSETLRGHLALVLAAADELLDVRGHASLTAAGLPDGLLPRLRRIVRLGAFVHDLGKCSDHFQQTVRKERAVPQLIRHEALSLWLCWPEQQLAQWLRPAVDSDMDYLLALLAAAGHHRKFLAAAFAEAGSGAGTSITLLVSHPDFTAALRRGADALGLLPPPLLTSSVTISVSRRSNPAADFLRWQAEAEAAVPADSENACLLAVSKALILCSDVAGSALPRSGAGLKWITEQLTTRGSRAELLGVVTRRLDGSEPRHFQREVASSAAPISLVRAGCGSGKTAAAYLWAAEQHAGRQLWVTYPTTGTATEGFRDYVNGLDELSPRLEHSRADVDFEIFGLRDGSEGTREQDRLDALRGWGSSVITCTVDTVLGLVQNQRKGLYAWPGLAQSAVVFDEIHAYDDQLFGCLLRFLEALPGIPALLMTASLPAFRLDELRGLCQRVHKRPLAEVDGPADLEALLRYRHQEAADPWPLVAECLDGGGKVLWVCNTVDDCIETAEQASQRGMMPCIYHSRFCYHHRVQRHGKVIAGFREPGAALAITTQVCEMSLDLSADLLVTQLAPIPALIQRLGRLNRRSTPQRPAPVRPFVTLPFAGPPYDEAELEQAKVWLAALTGRDLSQKDLVAAWSPKEHGRLARTPSAWLDGRFETLPASCRDSSPGITVLLPEHAALIRSGAARAAHWALPMNNPPGRAEAWRQWEQLPYCHYPIAPAGAIRYDELRGAKWQK